MRAFVLRWTVLAAFLLLWEMTARLLELLYFPPFSDVFMRMIQVWVYDFEAAAFPVTAVNHLVPSLGRSMLGWALAAVIGIIVGVSLGISTRLSALFEPVVHFLRTIPPVALVPIFMIVLGLGGRMRVSIIMFGCIWPVLLNSIHGVRAVDPVLLDTGQAFGIGRFSRLYRIYLPAASPKIFAGLRISLSIALILMVVSEMVAGGGTGGIGEFIIQSQRRFRIVDMWTAIVIVGFLGYFLNRTFELAERPLIGWSVEGSGRK